MLVNKKTFVFLVYACVLCAGSTRPDWPDYEYYPELQGWLKVHQEQVDWSTARTTCHGESALLAGPWINAFPITIARILSTKYPWLPAIYSSQGIRAGSTGIPMEPCGNKRCPVFLPTGVQGEKVICNKTLPFACFAPSCGDYYAYEYNGQTGQCYKLHEEAKNYPSAERTCRAEGGDLAQINDPAELKVLEGMANSLIFISNGGNTEQRHLYSGGGYGDWACSLEHYFICEKSATNAPGYDYRD